MSPAHVGDDSYPDYVDTEMPLLESGSDLSSPSPGRTGKQRDMAGSRYWNRRLPFARAGAVVSPDVSSEALGLIPSDPNAFDDRDPEYGASILVDEEGTSAKVSIDNNGPEGDGGKAGRRLGYEVHLTSINGESLDGLSQSDILKKVQSSRKDSVAISAQACLIGTRPRLQPSDSSDTLPTQSLSLFPSSFDEDSGDADIDTRGLIQKVKILEDRVHRLESPRGSRETLLPEDTFSMFVTSPLFCLSSLFSFCVFILQVATLAVLLGDSNTVNWNGFIQHGFKHGYNFFHVPFGVSKIVCFAQGLSLFLAAFFQEDITTACFVMKRGYKEEDYSVEYTSRRVDKRTNTPETYNFGRKTHYCCSSPWQIRYPRAQWIFHLIFRFIEGFFSLGAIFVLIMQKRNVEDVLLTFAGLEFVAMLDNIFFKLSEMGFFGQKIQNAAEKIIDTQYYNGDKDGGSGKGKSGSKGSSGDDDNNGNDSSGGPSKYKGVPKDGSGDGDDSSGGASKGKGRSKGDDDDAEKGNDKGNCCVRRLKYIIFAIVGIVYLTGASIIWKRQKDGKYLKLAFPGCLESFRNKTKLGNDFGYINFDIFRIGDGTCDFNEDDSEGLSKYVYNNQKCGWDGGDCEAENEQFRVGLVGECHEVDLRSIRDGKCTIVDKTCGHDGGDCVEFHLAFNTSSGGKNCTEVACCNVTEPFRLGDGECNLGSGYNTEECKSDGGDCDDFNDQYNITEYSGCVEGDPYCCLVKNASWLGDGICQYDYEDHGKHPFGDLDFVASGNSEVCGWDGGDCIHPDYPNCTSINPKRLGDNKCDGGAYNTEECGWDGGDCKKANEELWKRWPKCTGGVDPNSLGNGICNGGAHNTLECGWDRADCLYHNEKYPNCKVDNPSFLENGTCNTAYNTSECGWDGGDCLDFDAKYPNCTVDFFYWVGDDQCNGGSYNTIECGWDGGDCLHPEYPNCHVKNIDYIQNGHCDGGLYNTSECGWDGGDCIDCHAKFPQLIGDKKCDGGAYNTAECKWDGGDCLDFNEKYPNCIVDHPYYLGDGYCDGANYNTTECGWDGGDCIDPSEVYRPCIVKSNATIGNGHCDGGSYNTIECGWDGSDCWLRDYPNCHVDCPACLGDKKCDGGAYNTAECGWDGGDCSEFNKEYPNCHAKFPQLIGNKKCDGGAYNTAECGWDGKDCETFNEKYPNCTVDYPYYLGDSSCDAIGGVYNSFECGYDGGDCLAFNKKYPNCTVDYPSVIGDGHCDGDAFNIEECGWDGGDCETFNEKYPNCIVDHSEWVNDGQCDRDPYNTEDCGWDGGDCLTFNIKYPNCIVDYPYVVGDKQCDGGTYNSEECGWDGGDCLDFNSKYPNCIVDYPHYLGDGYCDGGVYNTEKCGGDGGDCEEAFDLDSWFNLEGWTPATDFDFSPSVDAGAISPTKVRSKESRHSERDDT